MAARSSPIRRAACSPKGHPLGATGLGAVRPSWSSQLRGTPTSARSRARKLALQHNLGLGGACVVTLYGRG